MAPLKLYINYMTPPSRAVMMVAEALGVPLTLIEVDVFVGDNKKPEYLKKNPMHTVPVLEEGDFILSDSHAIAAYLVTVYGKDDTLYPKEPKRRAIVDQRLHFDNGILYHRLRNCTILVYHAGLKKFTEDMIANVDEGYSFLEAYLSQSPWLAGDQMTIADICAVASVTCSEVVHPVDRKKYPKIDAWWKKLAQLPIYKKWCEPGANAFAEYLPQVLAKNNKVK